MKSLDGTRPQLIQPDEDDAEMDGFNCASTDDCVGFIDYEGEYIDVMCCDYGFRSGKGRVYNDDGALPSNGLSLGWENFVSEYASLRQSLRFDQYEQISTACPRTTPLGRTFNALSGKFVAFMAKIDVFLEDRGILPELSRANAYDPESQRSVPITPRCQRVRDQLRELKLDNHALWERERDRDAAGGKVDSPWWVRGPYFALCLLLDFLFENRPIQRFWFLECVARQPYFSYISMLHLYETLGWWRAGAELRKIHFAEEWNELHHLQIMESLGGDTLWVDRFLAQHAALVYYVLLIVLFFLAPASAYNFSELIEAHAVDTYGLFAEVNEEKLKAIPPPRVAVRYYRQGDLYMFDLFQSGRIAPEDKRRPRCSNLYDTFCNIRDDENEHVETMKSVQDYTVMDDVEEKRLQMETGPDLVDPRQAQKS